MKNLVHNHNPPQVEFVGDRLKDRVILITGASSGIGRAAAIRFAAEGASVVVGARREKLLGEVVAEITQAGGKALAVPLDVVDEESVVNAVERTVEAFGTLDGAFNNAGLIGSGAPTHKTEADYWRRVIDVNLMGVYLSMKREIPVMLANNGGSIVNTTSIGGFLAMPGFGDYCAAKHAVLGLTKSAAMEYALHGIRVNAVAPGTTRTPMWDELGEVHVAELEKNMKGWCPMDAVGLSDDIARVALFLLSEEARFITGVQLPSDGGQVAASRGSASRFEHWAEHGVPEAAGAQ
jgi:NAD(P)-dependent dehydrogenase (short-subunit alcohol dehydrogenase family)